MLTALAMAGGFAATGLGILNSKEKAHLERMDSLSYNIHVNGIRGKSTVTRMLGGMLREAGIPTIAKTTGTYACVIDTEAGEHPIRRTGPANINEQYKFIAQWIDGTPEALVAECMAVKPRYQQICQHAILRSPICVITNVRLDHQEEMGDTLEEIAESLCSTVPDNGIVVTSERKPEIVEVLRQQAEARNSRLIVCEKTDLSESLVKRFNYHQFEENIAIALTIAELLDLDMDAAIRGMIKANPDPGTTQVTEVVAADESSLFWVPMFAINDWESTTKVFRSAVSYTHLTLPTTPYV